MKQTVFYFIRADECEISWQKCNGALKTKKYYCVKLRVYTADDWYDSPCSTIVQTGNSIIFVVFRKS